MLERYTINYMRNLFRLTWLLTIGLDEFSKALSSICLVALLLMGAISLLTDQVLVLYSFGTFYAKPLLHHA